RSHAKIPARQILQTNDQQSGQDQRPSATRDPNNRTHSSRRSSKQVRQILPRDQEESRPPSRQDPAGRVSRTIRRITRQPSLGTSRVMGWVLGHYVHDETCIGDQESRILRVVAASLSLL